MPSGRRCWDGLVDGGGGAAGYERREKHKPNGGGCPQVFPGTLGCPKCHAESILCYVALYRYHFAGVERVEKRDEADTS